MNASTRNDALDNLRGIMMWLGIVLHVAINHMQAPSQLPWRDSQTSPVADLIVLLIHAFRMPLFFILAGFFAARLIEKRGHMGMLKNRLRRVGLPLLVFWPILTILMGALALVFVHLMVRGVVGIDAGLMPVRPADQPAIGRLHLWFMVDLLWLYGLSASLLHLRRYLPATGRLTAVAGLRLISTWWGVLMLTTPLALIGAMYPMGIPTPAVSFVPNLPELAYYGLFYGAGWVMYGQREAVFPRLQNSWGRYAVIGLLAFIAGIAVLKASVTPGNALAHPAALFGFLYSGTAWFWSLALIGAFSRYTARRTAWMSYLSESSYWVYLVHMLGTIGFGILLYDAALGFMAKMLVNIAATTAACLLSYHFFVRNSPIGALLNGGPAQRPIVSRPA